MCPPQLNRKTKPNQTKKKGKNKTKKQKQTIQISSTGFGIWSHCPDLSDLYERDGVKLLDWMASDSETVFFFFS